MTTLLTVVKIYNMYLLNKSTFLCMHLGFLLVISLLLNSEIILLLFKYIIYDFYSLKYHFKIIIIKH